MSREPVIALEQLVEHVASLKMYSLACPDGEPLPRERVRDLVRGYMRMAGHPEPSDALIDEIADDAMHWQAVPEDEVPEAVPDIEGDPGPTLIDNVLADDPSDERQAVREYFHRSRVPIPDDATINKMLERHARKHVQPNSSASPAPNM